MGVLLEGRILAAVVVVILQFFGGDQELQRSEDAGRISDNLPLLLLLV